MYVCMYVCLSVCLYVCTYVRKNTRTHAHTKSHTHTHTHTRPNWSPAIQIATAHFQVTNPCKRGWRWMTRLRGQERRTRRRGRRRPQQLLPPRSASRAPKPGASERRAAHTRAAKRARRSGSETAGGEARKSGLCPHQRQRSTCKAPALLASAPLALVQADARPPVLLASASLALVLADVRAPALLAFAPLALVLAGARAESSCPRTPFIRPFDAGAGRCSPPRTPCMCLSRWSASAAAGPFGRIDPRVCAARRSLAPGFGALEAEHSGRSCSGRRRPRRRVRRRRLVIQRHPVFHGFVTWKWAVAIWIAGLQLGRLLALARPSLLPSMPVRAVLVRKIQNLNFTVRENEISVVGPQRAVKDASVILGRAARRVAGYRQL